MGSGNDSESDLSLCPGGRSSPYMVGATACATVVFITKALKTDKMMLGCSIGQNTREVKFCVPFIFCPR